MGLKLSDPVSSLKGVGAAYSAALASAGIHTIRELLLQFPVDYLDCRREAERFVPGAAAFYAAEVVSLSLSRNYRRRLSTIHLQLRTAGGRVRARVFNQPWLSRQLHRGRRIWVYGHVDTAGEIPELTAPRIFLQAPEAMVPVYRETGGISRGRLGRLIHSALAVVEWPEEVLPAWILEQRRLRGLRESLEGIHLARGPVEGAPESFLDRFRYMEFFMFHLELRLVRKLLGNIPRRFTYLDAAGLRGEMEDRLGFPLTPGQAAALRDIEGDTAKPTAMQRLVQGDVGSGKTAVAFAALLLAARNGFQSVFLAPTEMLAVQHAEKAQRVLAPVPICLLTGSTPAPERRQIEQRIHNQEALVVFGTHALLNRRLTFPRLAMVVIDEQQRFGVSQRAALYGKSRGADLLVTTATPIPRTLMLALFQDLSTSTIRDRPPGREGVATRVLDASRRDVFYTWLSARLGKHAGESDDPERVFVVLPRIRPTEPAPETASLEVEGVELQKRLENVGAALISGETPVPERKRLLGDFRSGRLRVLIATTVVELGIDVPEATIMVIENADRFGLAQLHQLRGRVGRGQSLGQCYLIRSPSASEKGRQRLKIMAQEQDGFRLAEKDLEMRGGGEVAGERQAGSLDFCYGDPAGDAAVFLQAREDAGRVLDSSVMSTPWLEGIINSIRARIHRIHFS
ncbi:MAG: helicase-related protein [Acidobacteriota bacterium]|nr:helicase-related protein [Acidobacteriota bacterium]